jgi:hypothetical protein
MVGLWDIGRAFADCLFLANRWAMGIQRRACTKSEWRMGGDSRDRDVSARITNVARVASSAPGQSDETMKRDTSADCTAPANPTLELTFGSRVVFFQWSIVRRLPNAAQFLR